MTPKRKASELLQEPDASLARIRAMIELGRVEDDCDFMQNHPPPASAANPLIQRVQLPAWPEAVRGVPNGVLRSALFGAVKKGPKRYLKRERVASLEGVEILYTGERLDQGDLDVWQAVLHIARLQGLGNECRVTAYQLLKLLGKTDTGKNRDILDQRLTRMNATAVRVRIAGRHSYEGSLIEGVYRDEETREYVIRLDPKLRPLFDRDQWTAVDWAVRAELAGQPLAQWLHGFYATHAKPLPISVAKLHELCGSENQSLRGFKQELVSAFESVTRACEKHGQVFKAEIRNDLVYVDRQPSRSQQKHLDKKTKKPQAAGQRRKAMTSVGDLLNPKK